VVGVEAAQKELVRLTVAAVLREISGLLFKVSNASCALALQSASP
jgi:hypothetical protein